MQRIVHILGRRWAHGFVLLAIFMLVLAGGSYSHSPGHKHLHASGNTQNSSDHEHIELSEDFVIVTGSMLHCGADISADIKLGTSTILCPFNWRVVRIAKYLKPYSPTHDPPPPRILS